MKKWLGQFLDWIETSDQGVRQNKSRDNTGTSYDLQRLAYNLYCGRTENAQEILNNFVEKRVFKQIDDKGVQVEEIKRASLLGYSVSNISVMMNFIAIVCNQSLQFTPESSTRFYKAVNYLTSYLDENKQWHIRRFQT